MSLFYSQSETKEMLKTHNVVPVASLLPMNFDTSLSIFLKVKANFLLESAESAESMGRYSFIAVNAKRKFILQEKTIQDWKKNSTSNEFECVAEHNTRNPLEYLAQLMAMYYIDFDAFYHFPPFWGGLMGYLGYEGIQYFENIERIQKDSLVQIPLGIFIIPEQVLVVDHLKRQIWIISHIQKKEIEENSISFESQFQAIQKVHETIIEQITAPLPYIAWEYEKNIRERSDRIDAKSKEKSLDSIKFLEDTLVPMYHTSEEEYKSHISYCIERIHAGDIIQVVPSRQISIDFKCEDELMFFLRLRSVNPSPYMFFLRFDDFTIIGSSPESMVSLDENRTMSIKPIAGTIRRGSTKKEENELRNALISDEKEQAEHLMLVDLARNDLHRIAVPGTVHVPEFMQVQTFSHVLHIVSNVVGTLGPDYNVFDIIKSSFPAGTLSGAPKIEAMNIIGRKEKYKRNIYGGTIVVIGFNEYIDSCIAIRTTLIQDNRAYLQAGAGIVADSIEEKEWQESQFKLAALLQSFADIHA